MCAIEITTGPDIPRRSAIQDTELTHDGKEMLEWKPRRTAKPCGCYYNPINTAPPWSQAIYSSEKRTVSRAKNKCLKNTITLLSFVGARIYSSPCLELWLLSSPYCREQFMSMFRFSREKGVRWNVMLYTTDYAGATYLIALGNISTKGHRSQEGPEGI